MRELRKFPYTIAEGGEEEVESGQVEEAMQGPMPSTSASAEREVGPGHAEEGVYDTHQSTSPPAEGQTP